MDDPELQDGHLIITRSIRIPRSELQFAYSRSSGPGGQNVNKVNSRVTLRWGVMASPSLPEDVRERFAASYRSRITNEGEFVIHSELTRDQRKNLQDCEHKLKLMLQAVAKAPKVRRPTKPTRGSQERRLAEKKRRSDTRASRRPPSD